MFKTKYTFALIITTLLITTSSCATGGYCKSWNNPNSQAPTTDSITIYNHI